MLSITWRERYSVVAQRLTRTLASLDVTWRHVHGALKNQHKTDWCVLQFLENILLQAKLEKVQKGAARFVTGNYTYKTGRMTGIGVSLQDSHYSFVIVYVRVKIQSTEVKISDTAI